MGPHRSGCRQRDGRTGGSGATRLRAISRMRIDVRERVRGPHSWLILCLYHLFHRRATFLQDPTDSVKPTSWCPSTLPLRHPSWCAAPHSRVTGETSCLHTYWESLTTGLSAPSSAVSIAILRHRPTSRNSSDACALRKETAIPPRSSELTCSQRLKETMMKIDPTFRTTSRPVKPGRRTGAHELAATMPFHATARSLACASGQLLRRIRAIPARFLLGRRRHDAGVCDLERRMFELETHKISIRYLGGFPR
jgi:hypothetical protein